LSLLGLAAAFLLASCGAANASAPSGGNSTQDPSPAASAAAVGAPAIAPAVTAGGTVTAGSATAGTGVAYPYPTYPGTPGLAPDHTIVVTGFGQAPLAADMSNRATAQQTALKAALADAKAQADQVAHATAVTIQGVLSVAVSTTPSFVGPVPLAGGARPAAPNGSGGTPVPAQPNTPQLVVTVTVAYRIG
jgi:hypothetical protein